VAAPAWHKHISEREADGTWEDCTWDSGLEWYRLTYDKSKPATHAEAQALRKASGEPTTGGSNTNDLRRGIKARYGVPVVPEVSGFTALRNSLVPGTAGMVQGSMSAFGPTHRLSVYDRNFDGGHAVCIMNMAGTLLWCDPEAPTTAPVPVAVTWAEVAKYVNAFSGTHLVKYIIGMEPTGGDMPALTTYIPGYTANIKALSNIRSAPIKTAPLLRTVPAGTKEPVVLTGTVKGSIDTANGSDVWYTWWKNDRWEYSAKDNVIDIKAPAVPVPCPPDLSAELAQATADLIEAENENDTLSMENALLTAEVGTAAAAERERIAQAEAERIRKT
jgi:hypothetical protein